MRKSNVKSSALISIIATKGKRENRKTIERRDHGST
jgi:hypothetical protein